MFVKSKITKLNMKNWKDSISINPEVRFGKP
jgi:uncharacterized protein (DUF433 family)